MLKHKVFIFVLMVMTTFISTSEAFATEWNTIDAYRIGYRVYDHGNGQYKNSWVWCDNNGDYIAERYCYDDYHVLYREEATPDNEFVNEYGQWCIDGVVQKTYTIGNIEECEGGWKYHIKGPLYAQDEHLWLDLNDDMIAERYYFDESGYLVKGADKDTSKLSINDDGQWINNNSLQTVTLGYVAAVPVGESSVTKEALTLNNNINNTFININNIFIGVCIFLIIMFILCIIVYIRYK